MTDSLTFCDFIFVRNKLLNRQEIALLDVREEAPHAEGHPLFAANFPFSQIELNAFDKLPNLDVPIVTIDSGEGLAEASAIRLQNLGYSDVAIFAGGIAAWSAAGGELFIDVNVPSKAFGELMESTCHTPSLSAEEVKSMQQAGAKLLIVDVRPFEEYHSSCIPSGINVPGAELVRHLPAMIPDKETTIIINCAGRTRGLIGTQTLVNFGLENPLAFLRNGTIGWRLANQQLETTQQRSYPIREVSEKSAQRAREMADQSGVKRASANNLQAWQQQNNHTTYFFDIRSTKEYQTGHLPGFRSIPGGQLVQEMEMHAPVRGARIVLVDDDGVRANITASWLTQMAWDVYVLDNQIIAEFSESGDWLPALPEIPAHSAVSAEELQLWKQNDEPVIIDMSKFADYRKGHIPGACYVLRSQLESAISSLSTDCRIIVTSSDGILAQYSAADINQLTNKAVYVLSGGNQAWENAGFAMETENSKIISEPIDCYARPYVGTDVSPQAMQAYLDWEFGLIEQLARDGTHHFKALTQ